MVRNRADFFGLTNLVFTPSFLFFYFSNSGMELLPMIRNSRFLGTHQSGVYSNICFIIILFSNRGMELLPMVRNVFTVTFVFLFFFSSRGMELLPMVRNSRFFRTDQSGVYSSFYFIFSPTEVWSCFPRSETEQIFLD